MKKIFDNVLQKLKAASEKTAETIIGAVEKPMRPADLPGYDAMTTEHDRLDTESIAYSKAVLQKRIEQKEERANLGITGFLNTLNDEELENSRRRLDHAAKILTLVREWVNSFDDTTKRKIARHTYLQENVDFYLKHAQISYDLAKSEYDSWNTAAQERENTLDEIYLARLEIIYLSVNGAKNLALFRNEAGQAALQMQLSQDQFDSLLAIFLDSKKASETDTN